MRPDIIPCLRYENAPRAIDFLCEAFGFERHAVFADPDALRVFRLDAPPMTRLAQDLRKAGMPIREGVLTVEDMAKEVARLCK